MKDFVTIDWVKGTPIACGFDDVGGFYAVNATHAAYAYPTSTHARLARRNAVREATRMLAAESRWNHPAHIYEPYRTRIMEIAGIA